MMRRLSLHLLIAVLAFVVGVTAAMLLGRSTERTRKDKCRETNAVFFTTAVEESETPPARRYSCPSASEFTITALPDGADAPPPPAPPRVVERRETRIRIKRADGSVQVIKTAPAERH